MKMTKFSEIAKSCIMTGPGIVIGTGSLTTPSLDITRYIKCGASSWYVNMNISPVASKK